MLGDGKGVAGLLLHFVSRPVVCDGSRKYCWIHLSPPKGTCLTASFLTLLFKDQNAPRPSEHLTPQRKVSLKKLGSVSVRG